MGGRGDPLASAPMPMNVFLLKPAEPGPFDDMPTRPFHCTVVAQYPVTGSYAYVLVVWISAEDEKANEASFGSFPFTSDGALMLSGIRYELETLPLKVDEGEGLRLAVSVADIGSG